MKFVDIMKNAANIGSQIFLGIGPIFPDAKQPMPLVTNGTSNKIVAAIATIEYLTETIPAMKGMTGPEKLQAASAIAAQAIGMSSVLTNAKITDQPRYDLGVSKITDGWNDIAKSVEKN
jgi:hypothetical protein